MRWRAATVVHHPYYGFIRSQIGTGLLPAEL
jgi:hypothetical protein